MEYIPATENDAHRIAALVRDTICAVYPNFYPAEVVEFFCDLHSADRIRADIREGRVGILLDGQMLVGTGCYEDNHITRVYVSPHYQGRGGGSFIMEQLEAAIAATHKTVRLDASLPATLFYEKRGYVTVAHRHRPVQNGRVLAYEIMEKPLDVS